MLMCLAMGLAFAGCATDQTASNEPAPSETAEAPAPAPAQAESRPAAQPATQPSTQASGNPFIVLPSNPEARATSPWQSGGSATASSAGGYVQDGDAGSGVTSGRVRN